MQLASERIRNSADSFAAIAADVGYGSLPVFNRAFKRVTGSDARPIARGVRVSRARSVRHLRELLVRVVSD
jgi:AraC-like DNA-binding protein